MKSVIIALVAFVLSVVASARAATATVKLQWDDPNPAVIAKYVIYEQTSGTTWVKVLEVPAAVPPAATTTGVLTGVIAGTHKYAVTGVSTWGLESVQSDPVLYATSILKMLNFKIIEVVVSP